MDLATTLTCALALLLAAAEARDAWRHRARPATTPPTDRYGAPMSMPSPETAPARPGAHLALVWPPRRADLPQPTPSSEADAYYPAPAVPAPSREEEEADMQPLDFVDWFQIGATVALGIATLVLLVWPQALRA